MTAHKEGDPTTLSRLYGRSIGKPLRARQQALVDELLPKIAVPEEGPITAERLFGEDCPLHFEIGFGGGEHLAYRASTASRRRWSMSRNSGSPTFVCTMATRWGCCRAFPTAR